MSGSITRFASIVAGAALGFAAASVFFLYLSLGAGRYTLSALLIVAVAGFISLVGLWWLSAKLRSRISDSPALKIQPILDWLMLPREERTQITAEHAENIKRSITDFASYVASVIALLRAFGFIFAAITAAVSAAILIATLMQVERLDQQNELSEASRRAALVNELTAILTEIDEELDSSTYSEQKMGDIEEPKVGEGPTFVSGGVELSKRLVWRIVALSRSLRPYRFLEDGQLNAESYSPERGQLLMSLVASGVELKDIFRMGSFESAYLRGAELSNVYLRDTKLSHSNFDNANLIQSNLSDAILNGATFSNAILFNVNVENADMSNVKFGGARLTEPHLMSGAKLEGADLEGALVSAADWFEKLKQLEKPPSGLEYDKWKVVDSPVNWFFGGQSAGTAYEIRRKES